LFWYFCLGLVIFLWHYLVRVFLYLSFSRLAFLLWRGGIFVPSGTSFLRALLGSYIRAGKHVWIFLVIYFWSDEREWLIVAMYRYLVNSLRFQCITYA